MGGMTALLTSSNDFILIGEKREGKRFMVSPFVLMGRRGNVSFTPLESSSIYAGAGGNRKYQLLIEGGVKALPFLTGFTLHSCPNHNGQKEYCQLSLFLSPLFSR
jgi:hypothetical protein